MMSFRVRKVRSTKPPISLHALTRVVVPILRCFTQLRTHWARSIVLNTAEEKKKRTVKRSLTMLTASLVVLLITIGLLKTFVRAKELALSMMTVASASIATDEHGFTNILLLGEGDDNHDGIDLTDTIMVASLDPTRTKSAVLISIPRDTYLLTTEKMGEGRINSLYRDYKVSLMKKGKSESEASRESMEQLSHEIEVLLDMKMHGVVKVNFSGFQEGIDLIGGIDINVPESILDTEYPGEHYSYETFTISAGHQHLDGKTALKYARSRHSTSDFSRSSRQQQIIAAIVEKMTGGGIINNVKTLRNMLSLIRKNVESTFTDRELLGLAVLGKKIDRSRMVRVTLNDQNGLYGSMIEQGGFLYSPPREEFGGAAVLLPVSLPEKPVTWRQIQLCSRLLQEQRILFLRPSSIIILNAGAKEGSARLLGGELYRYGFNIQKTRNIAKGLPDVETTSIIINPRLKGEGNESAKKFAEATTSFLLKSLKMNRDERDDIFMPENADIAIVLGKDFHYIPLQNLSDDTKHP